MVPETLRPKKKKLFVSCNGLKKNRVGTSVKKIIMAGLEIRGCREPRAPLNSPAAPSNFCREPKHVLVFIHSTCKWLLKMQLGSLKKI